MKQQILLLPNETKVTATLNSRNFWISIISIIFTGLGAQGIDMMEPELISGEIYDAIIKGQVGTLISVLFVNFINPVIKIVRQKTWSWSFLRSVNFWVQFATVGLLGLASFGIVFPEGAAAEVVGSFFGGNFETIAIATIINILNPLWHFFQKNKTKVEVLGRKTKTIKEKDIDGDILDADLIRDIQLGHGVNVYQKLY